VSYTRTTGPERFDCPGKGRRLAGGGYLPPAASRGLRFGRPRTVRAGKVWALPMGDRLSSADPLPQPPGVPCLDSIRRVFHT